MSVNLIQSSIDKQIGVLISVIIPVFNCEDSLHLTVESLLNQSFQNIEIILVNDGSKDHSGYLCDQYANIDDRVVTVHQTNKGGAETRNTGIRMAQGEYISFIDAGDYVEINLYESLLQYVDNGVDLIDFPFFTQNRNGKYSSICRVEKNKVFKREFIEREMMPCLLNIEGNLLVNDPPICFVWKYLFKKSIVDDNQITFDVRRKKWNDKAFVVKYVDCCESIVFYDKPLITYVCISTGDRVSMSYFRNLVFLIIEQREEYQKKYQSRYSFKTDYYYANSISIIMDRIEEIVYNEKEEKAKELIEEVYSKQYVQSLSDWFFSNDDKMAQYQRLIKSNDIDETYKLMQQQIEQKNKIRQKNNCKKMIARLKNKAKGFIRPMYQRIKSKTDS